MTLKRLRSQPLNSPLQVSFVLSTEHMEEKCAFSYWDSESSNRVSIRKESGRQVTRQAPNRAALISELELYPMGVRP